MMRRYKSICGIAVFLAGFTMGCNSSKMATSDVTPEQIKTLAYLEPVSRISLIEGLTQPRLNDSLSMVTRNRLNSVVHSLNWLSISNTITINDTDQKEAVQNELFDLLQTLRNGKKISRVELPETIDSTMTAKNRRFALALLAVGFGRADDSRSARDLRVNIFNVDLSATEPVKPYIEIHAAILDAEKGNVAFYNNLTAIEHSPTSEKTIAEMLQRIFTGYFYKDYRDE